MIHLNVAIIGLLIFSMGCKSRSASIESRSSAKASTQFENGIEIDLGSFINTDPKLKKKLIEVMDEQEYNKEKARLSNLKSYQTPSAFQKLPEEEVIGIIAYTDENYYPPINRSLRNGNLEALTGLKPVILACASGLNRLPNFTGTVIRGANLPASVIEQYKSAQKNGTLYVQKEFLSTSNLKAVPKQFQGNTMYKIKSKTGHLISDISKFEEEKEVLFSPGREFKVTKVYEIPNPNKGRNLSLSDTSESSAYKHIFAGTDAIGFDMDWGSVNLADQPAPATVSVIEMEQVK